MSDKKTLSALFWAILFFIGVFLLLDRRIIPIEFRNNLGWLFAIIAITLFLIKNTKKKEERKKFSVMIVIFILLAISYSSMAPKWVKKDPKDLGKTSGDQTFNLDLGPITIPKSTSKVTEVEVTGKNPEGDVFLVEDLDGPGCYEITHVEGTKIYDNLQEYLEKSAYDIWGTDYIPSRKHYFPYANISGVQALEALIIADGEINGPKQVYQFPDCKRAVRIYAEQYLRIIWHGTFRPDINGDTSWDFQDNYGKWVFRIKKVNQINQKETKSPAKAGLIRILNIEFFHQALGFAPIKEARVPRMIMTSK